VEAALNLVDQFECLFTASSGNRFIYRFPPALVTQLTSSDDEDTIEQAAESWAAAEELGCEPDEARSIIEELVNLAWSAEESKKRMFLWICA
jgi:hypothetical protein